MAQARDDAARMVRRGRATLRALRRGGLRAAAAGWRRLRTEGPGRVQFWLLALVVGVVAGYAAIGFRLAISALQTQFYGVDDERLHSALVDLSPWVVVGVPILGGLAVGLLMRTFTDDGRVRSVAQVIEAAALHGGRVPLRSGLASAAASLITLSTGGSTGREGPVVHLAAVISSWVSARIDASPMTARELMGCAVAAGVSASFNAPIAGAVFALEVVLRHYALHAFAPITVAAIAGAVVSRTHMGDVTEFTLPEHSLGFYQELPAFLLLGLVAGLVAVALMKAIFAAEGAADRVQAATQLPNWVRPGVTGAMLGVIALWFPHIIGVGYETTSRALTGDLGFQEAIIFAAIKAAAVAITVAGRMGGGVFSPALMMGALTGLAFGQLAVDVFPAVSGSETLYALAGMGAVAAAVLGAPLSTTLIVFELTGDWQAGLAVMASVSTAIVVSSRFVDKSFFLTQLERRAVPLAEGPQSWIPRTIGVRDVMRLRGDENGASDSACRALIEQGAMLERGDTLERALPMFERRANVALLPVVERRDAETVELIGALFHVDALRAYNRALVETHREEHN